MCEACSLLWNYSLLGSLWHFVDGEATVGDASPIFNEPHYQALSNGDLANHQQAEFVPVTYPTTTVSTFPTTIQLSDSDATSDDFCWYLVRIVKRQAVLWLWFGEWQLPAALATGPAVGLLQLRSRQLTV